MTTQPTVCLVESLGFLEELTHREGEIISRTLQLSRKPSAYVYIRIREELEAVVHEFGRSEHRYLHLSCHGAVNAREQMIGLALTTGHIPNDDLADLLAPHMVGSIGFDDAAVFWTAFYHLMFKKRRGAMSNRTMEETVGVCATLVNERFRLFLREKADVRTVTVGPLKKPRPGGRDR